MNIATVKTMRRPSLGLLFLLSLSLTEPVYSCSCNFQRFRPDIISDTFCGSSRVYVGTVVGATCNCINSIRGTEENGDSEIFCQNYQLQGSSMDVVSTDIVGRGQCDNVLPSYYSEYYRNCAVLGTANVGVVPSGVSIEGPSDSNLPEFINVTTPDQQSCSLSCPFNQDNNDDDYDDEERSQDPVFTRMQPCVYRVRVGEVFRGNVSEGEVLTLYGPDVLTSCGNASRLLRINEDYLVGIGGACTAIPAWSTFESFSTEEIDRVRDLQSRYEAGSIDCGAIELLPSLILTALVVLLTVL